jgi:hypothetical protein
VPQVEQELLTLSEHLSSSLVFNWVRATRSLVLWVFCRSLFVLLSIFFWSLCCLSIKTRDELKCSERVSNSCSTCGTCCVYLVTNPVISHEWWKDWEVFTTSGTYLWSFHDLWHVQAAFEVLALNALFICKCALCIYISTNINNHYGFYSTR